MKRRDFVRSAALAGGALKAPIPLIAKERRNKEAFLISANNIRPLVVSI